MIIGKGELNAIVTYLKRLYNSTKDSIKRRHSKGLIMRITLLGNVDKENVCLDQR